MDLKKIARKKVDPSESTLEIELGLVVFLIKNPIF